MLCSGMFFPSSVAVCCKRIGGSPVAPAHARTLRGRVHRPYHPMTRAGCMAALPTGMGAQMEGEKQATS